MKVFVLGIGALPPLNSSHPIVDVKNIISIIIITNFIWKALALKIKWLKKVSTIAEFYLEIS